MTCCFLEGKGPVNAYDLESLLYLRKTYKDAVKENKKDTLLCADHAKAVDVMIAEIEGAGPKKYILKPVAPSPTVPRDRKEMASGREPGEEG